MTDEQKFILWLEGRLTAHGYTPGVIDGVYDAQAKAALTAFQRSRGLDPSGKADQRTVAALRKSSSRVAVSDRVDIPNRNVMPVDDGRGGPWPMQGDCIAVYGDPQSQIPSRLVTVPVPWDCRAAWDTSLKITRLRLHQDVADSAERCLLVVYDRLGIERIGRLGLTLCGGSYAKRRMRGGTSWSMHAFGVAIDWDPVRNGLKTHAPQARLSHDDARRWWEIWEAEGWVSLGREKDFDWMHVQAARL